MTEGERLRDEGVARVAGNNFDWLSEARLIAIGLARANGTVTADDVQAVLPRPEEVHPNTVGALFRGKDFQLVGYKKATRPSAHARRIGIYSLPGAPA